MANHEKKGAAFAYIGGTSYSGSTLLSFLLNAQPDVVSIGEMEWSIPNANPGRFPCSCGASLETCQFWLQVSQAMKTRGRLFDPDHWNTAFTIPADGLVRKLAVLSLESNFGERVRNNLIRKVTPWGKHLAEVGAQNTAIADSIVALTGASAFVDASKDPIRVRFLREYCAIEPHVIHLVRDSPAFVNSYVKNTGGADSFDAAIRWWNSTTKRMERLRRVTPADRWLRVRYEDLCANPETEIKRVLRFLGIPDKPPVLEFRLASHHIIGNRMRLGDSSEIRLDRSWCKELSKTQLDGILRRTMKYRRLLGYVGTVAC